jgi:hypothetical protein
VKGGRLKIVNVSRYPDEEVEVLVRFGLEEIDLTGERIVAVVKNTARGPYNRAIPYTGTAYSYFGGGIPSSLYDRYAGWRTKTHHLIVMRIGPPEAFPTRSFRRYAGVEKGEMRDWREALVAITAHEGKHAEHVHDGAYFKRGGKRRTGTQRIEPKCEAFEAGTLRRFREQRVIDPEGGTLLPFAEQTLLPTRGS